MRNPILETLGSNVTDPKIKVTISLDGKPWLFGSPANEANMTYEGYYRLGSKGQTYGPCVSVATSSHDATPERVLRILAHAAIGANPKPGQVAKIVATLRDRLTVAVT